MENPGNGITINVPAAANVIKDCATMANLYIPHYVFGTYGNPFTALANKFSLEQIKDFVDRAKKDFTTNQLLVLILERGRNQITLPTSTPLDSDPYGDYETAGTKQAQEAVEVYSLSKLFGII
jgi:hypothetical protein